MLLKVGTELKQWMREDSAFNEEQRQQQSPDASVPVFKGMYRLELVMDQGQLDKKRLFRLRMKGLARTHQDRLRVLRAAVVRSVLS